MADVFDRSCSRGIARLVLLALADEASDDGEVSAYRRSRTFLARKANASPSSVRRAIVELEQIGELEVTRRGSGREQSDYRIVLPNEGVHPAPAGAPPVTTQGVQPDPPGVSPLVPPSSHSSPVLPIGIPGAAPAAGPDELGARADAVARAVWEGKTPRPAIPFVGVRTVARRLLAAGWTDPEVAGAMLAAPTISIGAVEIQLNRSRGSTVTRAPLDDDRSTPAGLIEAP